jgi:hypothetical protein
VSKIRRHAGESVRSRAVWRAARGLLCAAAVKTMRRWGCLIAFGMFVSGGCTRTYHHRRPATIPALQATMMKHQNGIVTPLLQARVTQPPSSQPTVDLVPWGTSLTPAGTVPLVPLSAVRGYEVKRRFVGGVEGLLIGGGVGAFAGGFLGSLAGGGSSCENQDHCVDLFSSSDIIVFGAVMGGLTSAAVGAVIGALRGHTDRYLF